MRIYLLVLSILMIFNILNFISASYYNIELNQIEDNLAISEQLNFDSKINFSITLPSNYENLYVYENFTKINNTLIFRDSKASLVYSTKEYLKINDQGFYFIQKIIYPQNIDNVTVVLNLDKGILIKNEEIYPAGYEMKTDGEKISLTWKLSNVQKGNSTSFFVNLENFNKSTISLSFIIIILILIIIALAGIFLLYRKFFIINKQYEQHLIDSEKKVIFELKKAERNEMWQRQLQEKTNFSKAKISRVIRNLETRNLIKKIPFGNTNKISLK